MNRKRKKVYHTYRLGNEHGEIKFGHVTDDETISGILLRPGEDGGRHYYSMDASGSKEKGRKGGTMNVCPGSFQVKCGEDVKKETNAFYVECENGDAAIVVPNGRLRLIAENIDILATGADGKNGVVAIEGNEKVVIKSQIIEVNSKASTKIFSEKTTYVVGKAILDIYGGFIDCADGATKIKGSKECAGPYTNEENNRTLPLPLV